MVQIFGRGSVHKVRSGVPAISAVPAPAGAFVFSVVSGVSGVSGAEQPAQTSRVRPRIRDICNKFILVIRGFCPGWLIE